MLPTPTIHYARTARSLARVWPPCRYSGCRFCIVVSSRGDRAVQIGDPGVSGALNLWRSSFRGIDCRASPPLFAITGSPVSKTSAAQFRLCFCSCFAALRHDVAVVMLPLAPQTQHPTSHRVFPFGYPSTLHHRSAVLLPDAASLFPRVP